ncbi:MAG: hypothetical protein CMM18_03685 [Rhodospirillaceae bacterium]|nr:hypothetical protein [Rhodospirillaceae bacterium]
MKTIVKQQENNMPLLDHPFIQVNHDENARDEFVLGLKRHINLNFGPKLKDVYEKKAQPTFRKEKGRNFKSRHEARKQMVKEPTFQSWGSLWSTAQGLMWETSESKSVRQYDDLIEKTTVRGKKKGTIKTNKKLKIPRYVGAVDIHGMPGGYGLELNEKDIMSGALYDTSGSIYGKGQGLRGGNHPSLALIKFIKSRFPNLKPKRILEQGCSAGGSTFFWSKAFPESKIFAIDLGAGMLRMAHAKMEKMGVEVHFSQQNAENTDFPDNHFDLIISNIMIHETSTKALPRIKKDCHRILKNGGVMAHMDVPLRNKELSAYMEWYRDWSTHFNHEPFWGALHDMDIKKPIMAGGFKKQNIFDEMIPDDPHGVWWAAGGQKV